MRMTAVQPSMSSWPGLSRPSTSFPRQAKPEKQDVDARAKRGHDELRGHAGIP
jgi:hypothetical protein